MHALLGAEKCLRQKCSEQDVLIELRAISTPDSINETDSVCAMALEILSAEKKELVLQILNSEKKCPLGVHLVTAE